MSSSIKQKSHAQFATLMGNATPTCYIQKPTLSIPFSMVSPQGEDLPLYYRYILVWTREFPTSWTPIEHPNKSKPLSIWVKRGLAHGHQWPTRYRKVLYRRETRLPCVQLSKENSDDGGGEYGPGCANLPSILSLSSTPFLSSAPFSSSALFPSSINLRYHDQTLQHHLLPNTFLETQHLLAVLGEICSKTSLMK